MRRKSRFPGTVGRLILLLLMALALAAGAALRDVPAKAESSPQLVSMAVSVMPEYDQPSVFVSYRGDLNADVVTPLDVRMRLPGDASIDHACSLKPDGEHICHPFTLEPDGQYAALSYQAVTNVLYVEYHYGSVSGAGERDLSFSLWPPYPVQNLDLFVQQPRQASNFVLDPAPVDVVGEGEFSHYSYQFQGLSTDTPVDIRITYSRPTDEPSVQPGEAAAAEETQPAESSGGVSQTLMLVLALAGAAVLGLVLYAATARRFGLPALPFPRRAAIAPAPVDPGPASPPFCRHCGHELRVGSGFCSSCGQAVQVPAGGSE